MWVIIVIALYVPIAMWLGRKMAKLGDRYPEVPEDEEEQDYEEGTTPPRAA